MSRDDQWHLAILMGSFQYLENLKFPALVLKLTLGALDVHSAKNEEIVTVLLLATCCSQGDKQHFPEISTVIDAQDVAAAAAAAVMQLASSPASSSMGAK